MLLLLTFLDGKHQEYVSKVREMEFACSGQL